MNKIQMTSKVERQYFFFVVRSGQRMKISRKFTVCFLYKSQFYYGSLNEKILFFLIIFLYILQTKF